MRIINNIPLVCCFCEKELDIYLDRVHCPRCFVGGDRIYRGFAFSKVRYYINIYEELEALVFEPILGFWIQYSVKNDTTLIKDIGAIKIKFDFSSCKNIRDKINMLSIWA